MIKIQLTKKAAVEKIISEIKELMA